MTMTFRHSISSGRGNERRLRKRDTFLTLQERYAWAKEIYYRQELPVTFNRLHQVIVRVPQLRLVVRIVPAQFRVVMIVRVTYSNTVEMKLVLCSCFFG